MRRMVVSLILVASCLLACRQPPRMDTSSSAAISTSTKEVAESLSAADAKRFRSALRLISALEMWERHPSVFARALELGPTPVAPPSSGLTERVHGLTAKEVIALADQLAAETQRIHGLTAADVIAHALKIASDGKAKEVAARAAYERAAQAKRVEEALVRATETAYFPRIEIRRLKAERGSSPSLGGPYAEVFGQVKNLGDKTLDKVQVTVTLLDGGGKPLAGESHAVGMMRFDRDGAVAPLKPNDTRKFSRIILDLPSEWAGKVEARITAVKFAEPK